MLWWLKGWQKQPNKNWDWLSWPQQLSDPVEEAWTSGDVCARTWTQGKLFSPLLASIREIQGTIALVSAAGRNWLKAGDIWGTWQAVSFNENVHDSLGTPWLTLASEAMAVKGTCKTCLCYFSSAQAQMISTGVDKKVVATVSVKLFYL